MCGLSISPYSLAGSSNRLDIPAGDLIAALDLFARQAHAELIYSAEDLKGLHTRGVHGELTPNTALRELLAGTELTAVVHSSGAILITRSANPSDAAQGPQSARPVAVRRTQSNRQPEHVDEVVVTASRREEPLSSVGMGITTVSNDELETRSASGLEDFVALVPGVNVQSYGTAGYGVVSMRGISPQSSGATVAVYVDDIPFGGSSALPETAWYWPDIDPADLERVEVLKGPQGTLYGASSLGGVIKYVTRIPSLTTSEMSASEELNDVQGGSPGGKLRASVATPIVTNDLAVRVSGYYEFLGGYIDDVGIGGNDTNRGEKSGARATLLYQPLDNLQIRLNAGVQHSEVRGYDTTDDGGPTFQPLYGYFEQQRYTPESFKVLAQMFSAEAQWDTWLGRLISATSYSAFDSRQALDLTPDAAFFPPGVITPTNPAGELGGYYDAQKTQEIRFTSRQLGSFEFVAGTFWQHEGLEQTTAAYSYDTIGQVNPRGFLGSDANTGTLDEYAGFGDGTLYIIPQVDLTIGYRYSDIQQQDNKRLIGELYASPGSVDSYPPLATSAQVNQTYLGGIRWRITDEVMLYGRAATGYRPGGTRPVPPGAPAGFGDTYTSDGIRSYEAGIKVRASGGRLVLSADAYLIDWSKIQTFIYVGAENVNGNAGTARSHGAEFEAVYIPTEGLTLGANAAYTDARYTATSAAADVVAGQRLDYVPTLTRTLYIDCSLPFNSPWRPKIGAEYAYRSSQLDESGVALPAYTTFGVHAEIQFDHQALRFYARNLTNEHGIVGSEGYSAGAPYEVVYARPRTFGLIYSQKF
jgi:outer membrane receptor protein involved in Fe transport